MHSELLTFKDHPELQNNDFLFYYLLETKSSKLNINPQVLEFFSQYNTARNNALEKYQFRQPEITGELSCVEKGFLKQNKDFIFIVGVDFRNKEPYFTGRWIDEFEELVSGFVKDIKEYNR